MTLTEQASSIINQNGHTEDDITQLQRIKREMAKLYDEASTIAGMQESLYNAIRSETYINMKKKAKESDQKYTEAQLEMIAKDKAEREAGERRTAKSKASGMKAKIEAIKDFCVNYYTIQKNQTEASK